jgi:hypothetical protein
MLGLVPLIVLSFGWCPIHWIRKVVAMEEEIVINKVYVKMS